MAFDTTQHEGLENHVQTAKLVLVEFATLVLRGIFDVLGEPFIELVVRVE